jgi:PelA/Pel-15E family pectate lyase
MRHMRILALAAVLMTPVAAVAGIVGQATSAEPLSEQRVDRLAPPEREAWRAYLRRSQELMRADKAALAGERGPSRPVPPRPPEAKGGVNGMALGRGAPWYSSAEARLVADNIVSFQTPAGGWGKNQDRRGPVRVLGQSYVLIENLPAMAADDIKAMDSGWRYVGTIDNDATTREIRFLALVQAQLPGAGGDIYRAAMLKGIRYLLAAQFPNGGWPQIWPLQGGYHDALTYNDDAFLQVMELLADIGKGKPGYDFVPAPVRAQAANAVAKGLELILSTQVRVGGKPTVWAQQHDALTLAPAGARNFEPAALSSGESSSLLLFLMAQPDPSPEMAAAIRDGVAWLEAHALHGVEWKRDPTLGNRLVARPGAGPIWSRFYSIEGFKPIFGDRDKSIHDDVNEISLERRNGYGWFNTSAKKVLETYRKWSAARG